MATVSVVRCPDYKLDEVKKAVNQSFDNIGGISKFIKQGTKVALKVNLVMERKPEEAVTTHPVFVRAVAEIVREAGGQVLIAESPGGIYTESSLKSIYSITGMIQVAEESGIELNYDTVSVEVENPQGKYIKRLNIIKPLKDADVIINLPKLKAHSQMGYTGAVKNMFGAVPGIEKAEYHMRMPQYNNFADTIIDIYLSAKPTISLMDAIIGMERSSSSGDPVFMGLVLASEDGFALDQAALAIVDADPLDIPIMQQAKLRGLIPDVIDYVGEKLETVKVKDFEIIKSDKLKTLSFFRGPLKPFAILFVAKPIFNKNICTGCRTCVKSCPVKIISMKEKRPYADLSKCIHCFCCEELCPEKAIRVKRSGIGNFLMNQCAEPLVSLVSSVRALFGDK